MVGRSYDVTFPLQDNVLNKRYTREGSVYNGIVKKRFRYLREGCEVLSRGYVEG